MRYPLTKTPISESLAGLRFVVEYFDLLHVDVTHSVDSKSFDARAILRSCYHCAFLERGLASLPAPEAEEEPGDEDEAAAPAAAPQLGAGRERRSAAPAGAPAAASPAPISLRTHNLTLGAGNDQIYPSRLTSLSLDGASVNMGHKSGVVALLKQEVPHAIGVHAVAHVVELAWADALKGEPLIDEMLETNQMAYVHYAGSGKKKLSYNAACTALGEDQHELVSLHGIRWRESTHRGAKNLLLSWKARTLDLMEEASVEIGLKLTPLSPPASFLQQTFLKKTDAGEYGSGELTFVLKVTEYLGKNDDGLNTFKAKYMRVLRGRTCRGETEKFTQGDLLTYLLDASNQRERLFATAPGKLLERLTRYAYVKALAFWVDVTSEGKVLSKLFQRNGVLLSDVTSGVEDSISSVTALATSPGSFMKGLSKDHDAANQTLYGTELSGCEAGEDEYKTMLANVPQSITEHLNDRFCTILDNPVLKAACCFEHARWPSFASSRPQLEQHGEADVVSLLEHYATLYASLGGDASKAQREWRRLKLMVSRDANLFCLSYLELYERLFDHYSKKSNEQHYYNILLLIGIVMCLAVDTSVCERGFSLMNNLKTARRSQMGNELLRILMTLCSLGDEWKKDPSKIPVDEIVEEWRSQSKKGRYEAAMWRAAGLEEKAGSYGSSGSSGSSSGAAGGAGSSCVEDTEVGNFTAAGVFARFGRDNGAQGLGEHAGINLGTRRMAVSPASST